jgi:hypothetical protein
MGHLVLLGDSIFDNATYVPGKPAVIDQVRKALGGSWQATLVAVDGNVTIDIERQLARVPADATHFAVSVGGNDALRASSLLHQRAGRVSDGLEMLAEVAQQFRDDYRRMLQQLAGLGKPTILCTIYDAIPILGRAERIALSVFNDVICRVAFGAGVPLVDLRLICTQPDDYSSLSPIEPSHLGGAKIAVALARAAQTHDFQRPGCAVYIDA